MSVQSLPSILSMNCGILVSSFMLTKLKNMPLSSKWEIDVIKVTIRITFISYKHYSKTFKRVRYRPTSMV